MKVIMACRHGEALKNLKNVYGGNGSDLTENGVKQVEELSEKIKKITDYLKMPIQIYRSCDRIHVAQSAEILRSKLGVEEVKRDEEFKPIRLGVFDGMSREKQQELYPEACKAHQRWEKGEIDIKQAECLVEGAQPSLEYYEQVKGFLDKLPENEVHILFGTRSDNMCLYNIFKNQSPAKDMSYQFYNIGYAETMILSVDNEKQTKVWSLEEVTDKLDDLSQKRVLEQANLSTKHTPIEHD